MQILDIGCGFSGISIFLNDYFHKEASFWLLDRDNVTEDWKVGFHDDGSEFSSYNDFSEVRAFLHASGIQEDKIATINIDQEDFPKRVKFDVIISLLSLGYHYPVDIYASHIKESTSAGALIFLDLREGFYNLDEIQQKLQSTAQLIGTFGNANRYLFVRR